MYYVLFLTSIYFRHLLAWKHGILSLKLKDKDIRHETRVTDILTRVDQLELF